MLQLYPAYLLCNRCKTLTGSPDPTYMQSANKPCTHFSFRHYSQPSIHQVSADSNSPKERGEEDIHKLHNKRRHNQITKPSSSENRYKHSGGRTCHWCGNSHKPQECPAYGKQCLNCGIMNHYARVCNKRRSPRSFPNKPSFSVKRPQSP